MDDDPLDLPGPSLLPPVASPGVGLIETIRVAGADWFAMWRSRVRPTRMVAVVGLVAIALGVGWYTLLRPAPASFDEQLPQGVPPGVSSGTSGSSGVSAGTAVDGPAVPGAPGGVSTTLPSGLVIDVSGAVRHPGLVHLGAGARVADAVAAAGGVAAGADLERLNLAAAVADGERVFVPRVGEPSIPDAVNGDGAPSGAAGPTGGGDRASGTVPVAPVDLNSATAAELDALPGVGPATAAAIIRFRTQHGSFGSVDDLLQVPGIGPAKLSALRPHVRV